MEAKWVLWECCGLLPQLFQVWYLQVGPSAAQLLFMYPFVMDIPVCIITKTVIIIHAVSLEKLSQ